MGPWVAEHGLELFVLVVTVVAVFVRTENTLKIVTDSMNELKKEFHDHIQSVKPHPSCELHSPDLVRLKDAADKATTQGICNKIHADLDRRLNEQRDAILALQKGVVKVGNAVASIRPPLNNLLTWLSSRKALPRFDVNLDMLNSEEDDENGNAQN